MKAKADTHKVDTAAAQWLPIDALRPWDKNPRRNDGTPTDKVAASIKRFGFVAPIVVWRGGDRMVAGHTRLKAMKKLLAEDASFTAKGSPGPGLVRVVFQEFDSEDEADLYTLADNRLGELASWAEDGVADILARYNDDEKALVGFDELVVVAVDPSAEIQPTDVKESKTIDVDGIALEHKCPKCGFEFDSDE